MQKLGIVFCCWFVLGAACTDRKSANAEADDFWHPDSVTYSGYISSLISRKCLSCHRDEGMAPFSLAEYRDIAKRKKDIEYVTRHRIMPPWKADASYVSFRNDRSLSEAELSTLLRWVGNGMPGGREEAPDLPHHDGLSNIEPDLILKLAKPNQLKGNNQETFILNYIPFELDRNEYVSAIEFVGDNKKLVHHCTYYFYEVPDGVSLVGDNGPFDVDVSVTHSEAQKSRFKQLSRNLSFFAGWIPGAGPVQFPSNIGFQMPRRGMLMMTMHYAATPVDQEDNSYLKIYFHKKMPQRKANNISLGTGGIGTITPPLVLEAETKSDHRVEVPVTADISIFSVWPHMHYLGRSFKAFALDPAGDTIRLVRIPDWDFTWQEIYYFKNLVHIPQGSRIIIEATFDNTSDNRNNPFSPPKKIISKGNMATTDEMLTMMMMYLPYRKGDEKREL